MSNYLNPFVRVLQCVAVGWVFIHNLVLAEETTHRVTLTAPSISTKIVTVDSTDFTIPSQCEWTRAASPEMTTWPIVATWDVDGSLVIAESVWNKETVQAQLKSRPHRIVRLKDEDGDGIFDRRQVVAEQLSFPEGVLCIGKDILVTAPPEIWKLHDEDGDGVCESREVWFDGKTLTGCANDLHGPWMGPDGWIYWSKSAFAEQTHEIRSGETWKSTASHLYRRHPKGGPIEPVMTGGMDNLVDVAWLPNGERFFCATFLHHPRHGFRDGIGHAAYGAVFGKPHDVLKNHIKTGPLMEPLVELGPAAPAGLFYVPAVSLDDLEDQNPDMDERFAGYLLSAQFNLQKVGLHALRRSNDRSDYQADSQDLVSSSRIDFHPVDILQDRDGSLLIVDTGGWYDLCCPSSGTDQRIAKGGIYRLSGMTRNSTAGLKSTANNLGSDAFQSLRDLALNESKPDSARVDALFQAARFLVEDESNRPVRLLIQECVKSDASELRVAAMNLGSLYRMHEVCQSAAHQLIDSDMRCARLAAECLGRIGNKNSVSVLMDALRKPTVDRALEHAILFAMIELKAPEMVRKFLESSDPKQQAAALLVLEQTHQLVDSDVNRVLEMAGSNSSKLRDLALEALAQHPQWAAKAKTFIEAQWKTGSERSLSVVESVIPKWMDRPEVIELSTQFWKDSVESRSYRECMLGVLEQIPGRELPVSWYQPIAAIIQTAGEMESANLVAALARVRWAPANAITASLLQRIDATSSSDKLLWVSALPTGTAIAEESSATVLKSLFSSDGEQRQSAIRGLSRVKPTLSVAATLIEKLELFSPVELRSIVETVLCTNNADTDKGLLQKLPQVPAAKTLDTEFVVGLVKNRGDAIQAEWRAVLSELHRPPADVSADLDHWLAKIPEGDAKNGYHVFRSTKAACSACHQVGYVGGNIGPELSKIGKSRTRRDLIEAILYPSLRLAQSYQPIKIRTTDGEVLNGLVLREDDKQLELQLAADKRVIVAIADIEARQPSEVSIMPAGLEQQLSLSELSDLIAFLENAK